MPPKHLDHSSDDVSSDGDSENTLPLDHAEEGGAQPVLANGEMIQNNPNDEAYMVEDGHEIQTPPRSPDGSEIPSGGRVGEAGGTTVVPGARLMSNNPNDEMVPIMGETEVIDTPNKMDRKGEAVVSPLSSPQQDNSSSEAMPGGGSRPEEQVRLSSGTVPGMESAHNHLERSTDDDDDDDEEDDDENEEEDEGEYRAQGYAGQKPEAMTNLPEPAVMTNLEYNPMDYAKVNAKAPREMQDLFHHIMDFRPFVAELPTKLRPFIPDYIPAIGDLDPFVKIPRPDNRPDGLGLYVVDEPAIPQSNPAVVQLELRATNVHAGAGATVVDSFEDAANRPEVIDRWIADLKKVHYKKALPTVNYQKPMPDIENLMQVWPQSFEDVLNSDVQFPPPHIDLDIEQYVRTLCVVLDIPTYQSLIDPLHVMFTLYEDFRFNQHFQHE